MDPLPSNGPVPEYSGLSQCTSTPVDSVFLPHPTEPQDVDTRPESKTKLLAVGDFVAGYLKSGVLCLNSRSEKRLERFLKSLKNGGIKILDFDVMNHNTVVFVDSNSQVKIYDVSGWKTLSYFNLIGSPNVVRVLSHCFIAVGMTSGSVELIKWDKLKLTSTDFTLGDAINRQGSITSISGDDNRFLTTSSEGFVNIWDVASFLCWKRFRFPGSSSVLAIMGSKLFLICVSRNNISSTSVYSADSFQLILQMDHECEVISVIFSRDEDRFITIEESKSGGQTISVHETNTGETKWCWKWNTLVSEGWRKEYGAHISIFSEGRIGVSDCCVALIFRPPLQVAIQLDRPFFERNDALSQSFLPLQSGLIQIMQGTESPMSIVDEFIRPGQRMYPLLEWFSGHCLMMLVGLGANSNRSKGWKNARDFYRSASLHAFNSSHDVCIVRRCIQEAVDVGLGELDFSPNPEDFVDGRERELGPAFVMLLQKFLSPHARENRLRECLKVFHHNAEPFQFIGISLQLIAFGHEKQLKEAQVSFWPGEAAAEIRDDCSVARFIADLLLGTPLNLSEANSPKPVSSIRRVMMELHELYNAEAIEMMQNPEAEAKKEFLAKIGMTGDQLKILLSDWS